MFCKIHSLVSKVIWVTGLMGLLLSCVDNPDQRNVPATARKPVLENLANTVIIPGYENLLTKTVKMDLSIEAFTNQPNLARLTEVRADFQSVYAAWERVPFFDFGPAFTHTLRAELNTFPTDNFSIENAINSGNFVLQGFSTQNRRGLPAIDYLLYGGAESDEAIVKKFSEGENAQNRKAYLLAVSKLILSNVDFVYKGWVPEGGNYQAEFINKDGTDVGSSFGLMVNSLSQYIERFTRDARIGIPLGKRSQGIIIPRNVEAFYSGQSVALAKQHVAGLKDYYLGKNGDQDGKGFHEFLQEIKAGQDEKLAERILAQLNLILEKLDQVPSPLSQTIQNNPAPVEAVHVEMQKLVILIKTEFSSALGVLITYQDNDGD